MSTSASIVLRLAALAALASAPAAQTLYSIDSGAAPIITEFTGPPAPPCGYPNGPVLAAFPMAPIAPCPPPPIAFFPLGDVAFDVVANLVYATTGPTIGVLTPAGAPAGGFVQPFIGLLTGLGFNSAAGLLWMTDGALICAVAPPAGPCPAVPALVVPPFVPGIPLPVGSIITDVDWDPASASLWICTSTGIAANILPGGGPGPFLPFPAAAAACGLGIALTGIAVDTATPTFFGTPPVVYLTDGFGIGRVSVFGGVGALPTFYSPAPCFPAPPLPAIAGLASTSHAITYGVGCDTTGLPLPVMSSTGNSTTPGFMTIVLSSAVPGSSAYLFVDFAALCPAAIFKGCPLYALPTILIGPIVVPAAGGITLPALLPAGLPIGLSVYCQWVIDKPGPAFQASPGLEFTFGLP